MALQIRRNLWLFSGGGWEGSRRVPTVCRSSAHPSVGHGQDGAPSPHPGHGAWWDPAQERSGPAPVAVSGTGTPLLHRFGMAKHPSHGFGPFLSAPGLKTNYLFQAGWFLQCSLPSPHFTALCHSYSSPHDCPFSHSDTTTGSYPGFLWLLPCLECPTSLWEMLPQHPSSHRHWTHF